MFGGKGLKGSAAVSGMARQQLNTFSRFSRSMSSFGSPASRIPTRLPRLSQSLVGNASWKISSPMLGLTSARFNSTSTGSAAPAASATTVSTAAGDATDPAAIPSGTDVLSDLELSELPEKIGYLKELGLDHGWGPSAVMQFIIEHIHVWTGLPWWASIVGTGLLVRTFLLKFSIDAADNGARANNIRDKLAPLRSEMTRYAAEGNTLAAMNAKAEATKIQKEAGIKLSRTLIPFIQIPFFYGCFNVVRQMAALPVPGLLQESVLWLKDLTVADPYFILPISTAYFQYLSMKKGGEMGMNEFTNSAMGKAMLIGFPALSFVFFIWFPSALQLYFTATSLFALGQAHLLASPSFRRACGITPTKKQEDSSPQQNQNTLRLITDAVMADREKIRKAKEAKEAQETSIIDRTMNSAKETRKSLAREIKDLAGQSSETNADGTPAAPPRLSEKDRKRAASYERRRQEEEEWKRVERNEARREAHLKAMEAERQKAASAYKPKTKRT